MWTLGMLLCIVASGANIFFNFRQPSPQIVPLVLLYVFCTRFFAAFIFLRCEACASRAFWVRLDARCRSTPRLAALVPLPFLLPRPRLTPCLPNRLISYPAGKLMAYTLPIRVVKFPRWLGGFEFSLNPGPFNMKVRAPRHCPLWTQYLPDTFAGTCLDLHHGKRYFCLSRSPRDED